MAAGIRSPRRWRRCRKRMAGRIIARTRLLSTSAADHTDLWCSTAFLETNGLELVGGLCSWSPRSHEHLVISVGFITLRGIKRALGRRHDCAEECWITTYVFRLGRQWLRHCPRLPTLLYMVICRSAGGHNHCTKCLLWIYDAHRVIAVPEYLAVLGLETV